MIKQIEIQNYRGFKKHKIIFKKNVLIVGKNNAGKSTIIEILRVCSLVLKKAKTSNYQSVPVWIKDWKSQESRYKIKGISPDIKGLIKQYKTISYRYTNIQTYAKITFENGFCVEIYYALDEHIFAILYNAKGKNIKIKNKTNLEEIPTIAVLPQIGPLLQQEKLLGEDYIKRSELLPVTSLHFRNKLYNNNQYIEPFKKLINDTWSGLNFQSLEKNSDNILNLFVRDDDFVAEIGVMGHGLQMWLQILWFLICNRDAEALIIDEPDVYLHADLQRRLHYLLEGTEKQIILATHSLEFIINTNPKDILIVEKSKFQSTYAKNIPGVQAIIDDIGLSANIELIKFTNSKKCLFVEGDDNKILKIFYKTLFKNSKFDETPCFKTNGKGANNKVLWADEFVNASCGNNIKIYCLFDRDYSIESNENFLKEAAQKNIHVHFWLAKEIENYLLNLNVLLRILKKNNIEITKLQLIDILNKILEDLKPDIFDNLSTQIKQANNNYEVSTANKKAREIINNNWNTIEQKLLFAPGKTILRELRKYLQETYKISFSNHYIAQAFNKNDIPTEVTDFLKQFND